MTFQYLFATYATDFHLYKKLASSISWKSQEDLFTYSLLLRSVVPQPKMFYIKFFILIIKILKIEVLKISISKKSFTNLLSNEESNLNQHQIESLTRRKQKKTN